MTQSGHRLQPASEGKFCSWKSGILSRPATNGKVVLYCTGQTCVAVQLQFLRGPNVNVSTSARPV